MNTAFERLGLVELTDFEALLLTKQPTLKECKKHCIDLYGFYSSSKMDNCIHKCEEIFFDATARN